MPKRPAADYDHVERRIRAAMTLAGLEFDELANRIDSRNLGASTIRRLNAKANQPTALHYPAIARACDLPVEFFTVDFDRLPELAEQPAPAATDDRLDEVLDRLDALELRLAASGLEGPEQPPATRPANAGAQGGSRR